MDTGDYSEKYKLLFKLIKNHNISEFIKILKSIDHEDILFDINIRDDQNNYLLTYAITLNEIDATKLLIEKGAKIDITDKYDKSIIIIPINYSFLQILELLLEENKKNIGMSLIDIRDRNSKIPLHHAIDVNNFEAVKLLLQYGSNLNLTDKEGNNSLHLAVKSRSLKICELIVSNIANINSRCNTGETALHISCNLQLVEISKLLITNGIDVNIHDYNHEITPLHYSVLLNNKELIAVILKHGGNPNVQDIYGNTPLHYCVTENNFGIVLMLLQSKSTKNISNLNIWNIDGEIPLHLVLKNLTDNITDYMDILIPLSNLSIQDSEGNTCLHYLVKSGYWKKYSKELSKKRLNIFSLNFKNIMPIDYTDKKDFDYLISLTVESYVNRLQNAKYLWYYEWENICNKNFSELSKDNIKTLEKFKKNKENIKSENLQSVCSSIIKDKLIELYKNIKSGKKTNCIDQSFPMKRSDVCINISEGEKINYCTFTGSTLDILIGLIYLIKKHSKTCSTLSKNFSENKELCNFYRSMGIFMNSKCEFLNFEIVWVHQRLYLMDGFYEQFTNCIKNGARFIIIPLGIESREGNHANYLIYDSQINEIERFEPHGYNTPPGLYYNPSLLDGILESRFKNINENIKYIRPSDYLPKIGFQLMDVRENKKRKIGDPAGFCALWCIWYVDMRLTYRDTDRKKLANLLIKTVRSQNISFRNMIRNYSKYIIEIRDEILKKSDMDINDWLNDEYTDIQIENILKIIGLKINDITNN